MISAESRPKETESREVRPAEPDEAAVRDARGQGEGTERLHSKLRTGELIATAAEHRHRVHLLTPSLCFLQRNLFRCKSLWFWHYLFFFSVIFLRFRPFFIFSKTISSCSIILAHFSHFLNNAKIQISRWKTKTTKFTIIKMSSLRFSTVYFSVE